MISGPEGGSTTRTLLREAFLSLSVRPASAPRSVGGMIFAIHSPMLMRRYILLCTYMINCQARPPTAWGNASADISCCPLPDRAEPRCLLLACTNPLRPRTDVRLGARSNHLQFVGQGTTVAAYFERLRGWLCRVLTSTSSPWRATFDFLAHAGAPPAPCERALCASDRFAALGHPARRWSLARSAPMHRPEPMLLPSVLGRFAVCCSLGSFLVEDGYHVRYAARIRRSVAAPRTIGIV